MPSPRDYQAGQGFSSFPNSHLGTHPLLKFYFVLRPAHHLRVPHIVIEAAKWNFANYWVPKWEFLSLPTNLVNDHAKTRARTFALRIPTGFHIIAQHHRAYVMLRGRKIQFRRQVHSKIQFLSLPTNLVNDYAKTRARTFALRIPTGFHIIAQGCGTPLPRVSNISPSLFSTPTELRRFSHTAFAPM